MSQQAQKDLGKAVSKAIKECVAKNDGDITYADVIGMLEYIKHEYLAAAVKAANESKQNGGEFRLCI